MQVIAMSLLAAQPRPQTDASREDTMVSWIDTLGSMQVLGVQDPLRLVLFDM